MRKRVNLCLALCLFFLFSTSSIVLAEETSRTFPNVGTINFPTDVEILPLQLDMNGVPGCTLLTLDNKTWRSVNIYFTDVFPTRKELKAFADSIDGLITAANARIQKDGYSNLIANSKLNKLAINNDQLITQGSNFYKDDAIVCMNYYAIDRIDGSVLMITLATDGDSSYWSPKIAKMIADIKR